MSKRPYHTHDLTFLYHLQVLLKSGSVSRAAERIGISQPAMSRILARLRDQFRDPLLVRGHDGMTLTPRARALSEPLDRWLREGEALLQDAEFDPRSARRTFRIASTDFGILSVLAGAVARFEAEAPRCSIEVQPLSDTSIRSLAEGDMDIVITGYAPEGEKLRSKLLFSDSFLGLVRKDHPAIGSLHSKDDLLQWPHIIANVGEGFSDWVGNALPGLGANRNVIRSNSFLVTPYLVEASDAIAILPARAATRFVATHGLDAVPLPIDFAPLDYYLIWHERSQNDAATQWLTGIISSCLPGA